jgi:hypothetical protein
LLINYLLIIHTDEITPLFDYFFIRFSNEKQLFIIEEYRKILDDVAFQYKLNFIQLDYAKKKINDCLTLFEKRISNPEDKKETKINVFNIDKEKLETSFNILQKNGVINVGDRVLFLAFFQNDLNLQVRFDASSIQVKYLIKRMIFNDTPYNNYIQEISVKIDKKISYKTNKGIYKHISDKQFLRVFYDNNKSPKSKEKPLLIKEFPLCTKKREIK